MGNGVSTKPGNKYMVDKLVESPQSYIRSAKVEGAFRAVDRALYYEIEDDEPADPYVVENPWRQGNLHLSSPSIYATVVEALDLRSGMSFLNLGSGTGYLNTIVGLLIGPNGINHGIELHKDVVEYANKRLQQFMEESCAIDKYDFVEPLFIKGNFVNLDPKARYDRIYLGAECLPNLEMFMKKLVKTNGGILVMPIENRLMRHFRLSETEWRSEKLMDVSFTSMIGRNGNPFDDDDDEKMIEIPLITAKPLKDLCRIVIRQQLRHKTNLMKPNLLNSDNLDRRRRRAEMAQSAMRRSEQQRLAKERTDAANAALATLQSSRLRSRAVGTAATQTMCKRCQVKRSQAKKRKCHSCCCDCKLIGQSIQVSNSRPSTMAGHSYPSSGAIPSSTDSLTERILTRSSSRLIRDETLPGATLVTSSSTSRQIPSATTSRTSRLPPQMFGSGSSRVPPAVQVLDDDDDDDDDDDVDGRGTNNELVSEQDDDDSGDNLKFLLSACRDCEDLPSAPWWRPRLGRQPNELAPIAPRGFGLFDLVSVGIVHDDDTSLRSPSLSTPTSGSSASNDDDDDDEGNQSVDTRGDEDDDDDEGFSREGEHDVEDEDENNSSLSGSWDDFFQEGSGEDDTHAAPATTHSSSCRSRRTCRRNPRWVESQDEDNEAPGNCGEEPVSSRLRSKRIHLDHSGEIVVGAAAAAAATTSGTPGASSGREPLPPTTSTSSHNDETHPTNHKGHQRHCSNCCRHHRSTHSARYELLAHASNRRQQQAQHQPNHNHHYHHPRRYHHELMPDSGGRHHLRSSPGSLISRNSLAPNCTHANARFGPARVPLQALLASLAGASSSSGGGGNSRWLPPPAAYSGDCAGISLDRIGRRSSSTQAMRSMPGGGTTMATTPAHDGRPTMTGRACSLRSMGLRGYVNDDKVDDDDDEEEDVEDDEDNDDDDDDDDDDEVAVALDVSMSQRRSSLLRDQQHRQLAAGLFIFGRGRSPRKLYQRPRPVGNCPVAAAAATTTAPPSRHLPASEASNLRATMLGPMMDHHQNQIHSLKRKRERQSSSESSKLRPGASQPASVMSSPPPPSGSSRSNRGHGASCSESLQGHHHHHHHHHHHQQQQQQHQQQQRKQTVRSAGTSTSPATTSASSRARYCCSCAQSATNADETLATQSFQSTSSFSSSSSPSSSSTYFSLPSSSSPQLIRQIHADQLEGTSPASRQTGATRATSNAYASTSSSSGGSGGGGVVTVGSGGVIPTLTTRVITSRPHSEDLLDNGAAARLASCKARRDTCARRSALSGCLRSSGGASSGAQAASGEPWNVPRSSAATGNEELGDRARASSRPATTNAGTATDQRARSPDQQQPSWRPSNNCSHHHCHQHSHHQHHHHHHHCSRAHVQAPSHRCLRHLHHCRQRHQCRRNHHQLHQRQQTSERQREFQTRCRKKREQLLKRAGGGAGELGAGGDRLGRCRNGAANSGHRSRRPKENECEKYRSYISSYIKRLPVPRVLHDYLNYERQF